MEDDLADLASHAAREGKRRFSRWDGALLDAIVRGPGQKLARSLAGAEAGMRAFEGWLALVVEAIGLGYVRPGLALEGHDGEARAPTNLVELLLVEILPDKLASVPAEARASLLAKAWNLGEGLFGEPPWLNQCVASALAASKGRGPIVDLEGKLLAILDAALAPRARSSFRGPFAVRVVDLRPVEPAFLPGRVHFGAPTLVCVHDRRRPSLAAGVLVGARGAESLVFRSPCLGRAAFEGVAAEDPGVPTVTLARGGVHVGGARVPLPLFVRGHSVAASRAGICAASALDSQRLWIVESP